MHAHERLCQLYQADILTAHNTHTENAQKHSQSIPRALQERTALIHNVTPYHTESYA